ncbi:type II toxin-antitoxin system VapC family toxin [Bifidobacterium biavatii]|uniref:Ribonuclease VapC n=1 Tax=Bifidobacterium biavatii DSM 23969 TaxID=1437608 RepID=A0A086ZT55_9BIFI|nr:type II toxin-antitoxin system VapC family toxin [Bifidobacterium biavatii]KFI49705.1 pilus biogenesis protein [Bifidobacterium biavatii DSM 23969]
MIILDTNVISEIISKRSPDRNVEDWVIATSLHEMHLTSITIAELLYGLALLPESRRRYRLEHTVLACVDTFQERTLPFDRQAAPYYGSIVATRRKIGRPIGVQDAMIAAIARSRGATLATRNVKDFEHTGVTLVNPWENSESAA